MRCRAGCHWSRRRQDHRGQARGGRSELAWSGTGINLRTGTPSPTRLRRAVRSALANPRYRIEAAHLRREIIGAGDPLATVAETIESLVSHAGPAVSYGVLDEA